MFRIVRTSGAGAGREGRSRLLRLILALVLWSSSVFLAFGGGAALAQGAAAPVAELRHRDSYAPGSTGNRVQMTLQNNTGAVLYGVRAMPQQPLRWVTVESIEPALATLAPGQSQDFALSFSVAPGAPLDGGEAVVVFFTVDDGTNVMRADVVVDFAGTAAPPEGDALPEMDVVEFRESFKAGTSGNAVVFRVENTTAFPVEGLDLRPQLPARYLTLDRIEPRNVALEPGEKIEITAEFSVREDADVDAEDTIDFHFEIASGPMLPIPRYRLIALIEEGETGAKCNSAVDFGGDEGGGVTVDLGDFTGKAGFTWEMFNIKDQMDVTVGGATKTTGCVSGSGTFEFDIPPGAGSATVKVLPNCEDTTGTAWNFRFECPLSSDVTADGSGNALPGSDADDGADTASTGSPGQRAPTAAGAPVTPAPPPPAAIGPTGATAAEAEQNETPATATPLSIGDAVSGSVGRRGDADHFLVTLAHQGELTVSFPSVPAGINIAFRVLDASGRQVWGWQGADRTGAPFSAWADIASPGDYVIEVRDGGSDSESPDSYTMVPTFIPTADPAEPNNDVATATPLGWNQAMAANILPRGDADHYRVSAGRQGQLTLQFTRSGAELNMAFRVLDTSGRQVWGWQGAAQNGQGYSGTADLTAPGDYVIEVRDGGSDARSAVPYEIVASLDPTLDPAEPNDDVASATPIGFGVPVWASILPRGDVDHYRIDVTHQGELTVDFVESPGNLNMAFRVLDTDGRQVWGWQGAGANGAAYRGWADLVRPGTYIVEVRDGGSDARSPEPYGMVATFTATRDPAEPNDAAAEATPLALGERIEASILPRGDADLYRIDAPRQGELAIEFDASPPDLNMAFRVLDTDGRQIWGWQGTAANGQRYRGSADLKAPGTYFVEVRDGGSDARSVLPYAVTATLAETRDPAEPNDTPATATPLALGGRVAASILPRGDADHYRVSLPVQGQLNVAFDTAPAGLNMAFRVLDPAGRQVWGWQGATGNGETYRGWADLKAPGEYVIEVRDGGSDGRSPDAYDMSVTLEPTADAAEPNDDPGTATEITAGTAVSGSILPRGDADYYRFKGAAGRMTLGFVQSPANLNMAYRVLDTAGRQVWGWQGAATNGEAHSSTFELPAAGTYLIEVRDGGSDDRSPAPYVFVLSGG